MSDPAFVEVLQSAEGDDSQSLVQMDDLTRILIMLKKFEYKYTMP